MDEQISVNLAGLRSDLQAKSARYREASPFPHIVLDDVLLPEAFERAVAEFPAIDDPLWKGFIHVNETKYSHTVPEEWGPVLHQVARELCAPEFVAFLEELTGIEDLLPDWEMDGGGLHQTLRGGHLNVHADFTSHHTHEHWARRVNILLYLNDEWLPEWGGQLELWDREMTACQAKVTPKGNRMLVFSTGVDTFHGHPDGLTCPPDVARRSLALYYFTEHEERAPRRSTNYRARPEESVLRRAAIAGDRRALDLYDRVKRRWGISDDAVHQVLKRFGRRKGR